MTSTYSETVHPKTLAMIGSVVLTELGEFFSHECPYADVLEAYGIDHAAGGLAHPGSWRPAIG